PSRDAGVVVVPLAVEHEHEERVQGEPDEEERCASFVTRAGRELLERAHDRVLLPEAQTTEAVGIGHRLAGVPVMRLIVPGAPEGGGEAVDPEAEIANELLQLEVLGASWVDRLVCE